MVEQLSKCPFCNVAPINVQKTDFLGAFPAFFVKCEYNSCHMKVRTKNRPDPGSAIADWNKRVPLGVTFDRNHTQM